MVYQGESAVITSYSIHYTKLYDNGEDIPLACIAEAKEWNLHVIRVDEDNVETIVKRFNTGGSEMPA